MPADKPKNIGISALPQSPKLKEENLAPFLNLLKRSWNIYTKYIKKFIGMYFLVLGPALVGALLIAGVSESTKLGNAAVLPLMFLLLVFFIFAVIVGSYSMIFLIKGLDKNIGVWQAYVQAWKYFWIYLWLFVLTFVIVGLGFVALVIPGLVLLIWFSQVFYIVAFEDVRGVKALQRSKEIVEGFWWSILERYLYWLFLVLAVNILLVLPLVVLALAGVPDNILGIMQVLVSIASMVVNFIIIPVGIIFTYLVYKNLRMIKDKESKVQDGLSIGKKFGIAALVIVYAILNGFLDYNTDDYEVDINSEFNYEFNLDK